MNYNENEVKKYFRHDYIFHNIYFVLINTEVYKEYLKTVPHREFLDMSIIYKVLIDKTEEGITSYVLTYEHLMALGLIEQNLYDRAKTNTFNLFVPYFAKVQDKIIDTLKSKTFEAGELEKVEIEREIKRLEKEACDSIVYCISNANFIYGATYILNVDIMDCIAEIFNDDFYISPSSVHECVLIPAGKLDDLSIMLDTLIFSNRELVASKEILSNNIYKYDRKSRSITVAATGNENILTA